MTTKADSAGAADNKADFGAALRAYRLAAGLSQRELAERAGLSARGVQNLERGVRRPYADTVRRLARALGLTPLQRAWLEAVGRDARAHRLASRRGVGTAPFEPSQISPEDPGSAERKPATALALRIAYRPAGDAALSSSAVRRMIDAAVDEARAILERYGGVVAQVDDGGLVAVFGIPIALEDHAARSIHAARTIWAMLDLDGGRARDDQAISLSMSIGLDSGLLDVRRRGQDWELDARGLSRADGSTDHSPIEAAVLVRRGAPAGCIRASTATVRAGGEGHVWIGIATGGEGQAPGRTARDGSAERSEVYELDVRADATARDAFGATVQTMPPCVGRSTELGRLRSAWTAVETGHGRVVALIGEAGIGKSRLLAELRLELTDAGVRWYEASCFSFAGAIPFAPFRQVLRASLGLPDDASTIAARTGVLRRVVECGIDPGRAPYLAHVLGYRIDDRALTRLPPEVLRDRAVEAAVDALLTDDHQPLVLAIEDVHWLDRGSEAIVAALAEAAPAHRLLMLMTARPDALHAWTSRPHSESTAAVAASAGAAGTIRAILAQPYAEEIVPAHLAPAESETLIRDAGGAAFPATLIEQVARQAGGNPLFAEALTRAVLERGGTESRASADSLALPPSIHAVLLARIDRLPSELKRVLQVAATIGATFDASVLGRVLDAPDWLDASLLRLLDLGLVTRQTPLVARRYAFRHELLQTVVYETLSAAGRAALHERVGLAVEALADESLDEHAELLAYHFGRSGNDDKAIEYLALAGRRAVDMAAMAEAGAAFDEALRRLDAAPDSMNNRRRRVRILADQFPVALLLGGLPAYAKQLARDETMADALDDPALLSAYLTRRGACAWAAGRPAEGRAVLIRALELAEAADNDAERGAACTMLARCELDLGAFERSLSMHERAVSALERRFDPHWYSWTHTTALWAHAYRGRWESAGQAGAAALRAGEAADDPVMVTNALLNLALVSVRQGDLERARGQARRAVEQAATPADQAQAQGALAVVECARGGAEHALPVLEAMHAALAAVGIVPAALFAGIELGGAYLDAGRPDAARATLTTCHADAARGELHAFRGRAAWLLGEADLAIERLDSAAGHFEEAIEILTKIGAENDLALAFAGRGRLRQRRGEAGPARDDLCRARAIFERLGTLGAPDRVLDDLASLDDGTVAEPATLKLP